MWEGYVALGVALLFMGFLLYGTHRRTEEFTTMKGNFPPFMEIQRTVRGIFDEYYDYSLSEFSKIEQVDVFNQAKKNIDSMTQNSFFVSQIPIKFIIEDPDKLEQTVKDERTMKLIKEFKTFMPPGFSPNLETVPIDTHMAVLHAARRWLTSKIRTYKAGEFLPIEQLLLGSLALDALTQGFKNAVTGLYIAIALQLVNPKPKKPT